MKTALQKMLMIVACIALLLGCVALIGVWQVQRLIADMGIEKLDYRVEKIRWHSLDFSHLSLLYRTEGSQHTIAANDLRLRWKWAALFTPQLLSVTGDHVDWQWESQPHELDEPDTTAWALPDDWNVPVFFPAEVHINSIQLALPCPAGQCRFNGQVNVHRRGEGVNVEAQFTPGMAVDDAQKIQLLAAYQVENTLPVVEIKLALGEHIHAQLHTQLLNTPSLEWSGKLIADARYPDAWVLALLDEWNITLGNQWSEAVNQPVNIHSEWQLELSPLLHADVAQWHTALNGRLALDATLAAPITLQGWGTFSGECVINLHAADNQLQTYDVAATLNARQLAIPESLTAMGIAVDELSLTVNSRQDSVSLAELPFQITARTAGKLQTDVTANGAVNLPDKKLTLEKMQVDAALAELLPAETIQLGKLRLAWQLAGEWQPDKFSLRTIAPGKLDADVQVKDISLSGKSVQFSLDNLRLSGAAIDGVPDWSGLSISTDAVLKIAQLQYPQLHTKPWLWQGELHGTQNDFTAKGTLTINNAIVLPHTIKRSNANLAFDWQLRDSFFLAGNPFADLVVDWPSLLSLAQGKVKADGKVQFDLEHNQLKQTRATVVASDISGVYDTVLFQGVSSTLSLSAKPDSLLVATDEVRIRQVNKGLVFGPLRAAGSYAANWDKPVEGKFSLQYFTGDVMGGSMTTPAQVFDLAKEKQSLVLTLNNIDLAMLLQQHPSAELSGSGRLSGSIPIELTAQGVSVPKGALAAQPPGGQLQFHSERADAIARTQPSMKLITDALDDFHYTVLASEVTYEESGKLLLSLRLEGKNPALEKGRPVHFNINLEEDLPAMLASIQLSNQISDVIKKRLQQHLQKRSTR